MRPKQNSIRLLAITSIAGLAIFQTSPALALGEITLPYATPYATPYVTPYETPYVTPVVEPVAPIVQPIVQTDTTPPVISGVAEVSLLDNEAVIVWTTDELATSQIRWGTSENYNQTLALNVSAGLVHSGTLLSLNPGTIYYYCIDATDLSGNIAHSCNHEFATSSSSSSESSSGQVLTDTNPPTVSMIDLSNITTTHATINWTTDEVADSQVEYGLTAEYGSSSSFDSALSLSHSITLSNLSPNTEYHYRVRSADQIGNIAHSVDNVFTTSSVSVATNSPEVMISSVEASEITRTGATIIWTTSLPADSQVEYGDSQLLGSQTTLDSTLTTSHSVAIANLASDTNYFFRVKSASVASAVDEFNTLAEPIFTSTPANIVSVGTSVLPSSAAGITWTTDEPTTGRVEYGISTAYGQTSDMSSALALSHSVSLSNLSSATIYHFRVKAENATGDITYSADQTFTTQTGTSQAPSAPEVQQGNLENTNPAEVVPPTTIYAEGVDGQIVIGWENPNSSDVETVIERGGQIIYEGHGNTFTDTSLTNGQTYNYTIYDSVQGSYSVPIHISVAPNSGKHEVVLHENPVIIPATVKDHFTQEFKKGDRGIEIEHLQEVLASDDDTYPRKIISGYFSVLTEAAVKKFQAEHGLLQTGITDQATQVKLNLVSRELVKLQAPEELVLFDNNLRLGNAGDEVEQLQEFLTHEGSYAGSITGRFDQNTKNAVIAFQKKYGVKPAIGFVGPKTRHKIKVISGF